MRRLLWILSIMVLLAVCAPTRAQSAAVTPLDWIPADFAGFVRLDITDSSTTLQDLNVASFVASVLQPTRASYSQSQTFDTYFPLDTFDVENLSFTQDVLPWIKNEVIVAYRSLGPTFEADPADTILILPTIDAFESADLLSQVIKGQDFPKQESYRDVIIYAGDKTSFAFTPSAVIVGPDDLLHETIDTIDGDHPALSADPVYQQVRAALPANNLIFAYLAKDAASRALSVLVSGSDAADPILSAITQSLDALNSARTPDRLLLSGALDGIGVSVDYDRLHTANAQASVILHTTSAPDATTAVFDPSVLDLIPRSAMFVQSGADASSAVTDALYSLPFADFADQALAAFPISPSAGTGILPTPSAQDVEAAVSTFLDSVKPVVDVQNDVLDKLDGSYALALMPRPNNPLPVLNTPFDLLLVVKTDSAATAQAVEASVSKLLATFSAPLQAEQVESQSFQTLNAPGGDPLVQVGAVDNMLVIGTGSAAQLALDAQRGDDRLTKQDRWTNLTQNDQIPYVYVDVNAVYNTFLPTLGGPALRPVSQLGIQSRYLGDSLFELNLLVALTQQ